MKSTLSDNKQLFNVNNIAYSTTLDALAEGEFGIYPEDSDTSIANTIVFATLPERFRFVSKLNGKVYYSLDTIEKSRMSNQLAKAYEAQVVNEWKATVNHCECAEGFKIKINIDEQSLIQRDGLTWTHSDFVVGVTAEEIDCQCSGGVLSGYDNNIITKMAVEKINAINSPFYEASAEEVGGAAIPDIDAFIATNLAVNQDGDPLTDVLMVLVITGKAQAAPNYADLEVNYIYPRGVKLAPTISVNDGTKSFAFAETQSLVYEAGAGYDLRAEEFDCMSLYTNLNHYPQLSDGIQSQNLVYQFQNAVNYNTLTFEFGSKKSGLEDVPEGSHKQFSVLLGTSDGPTFTELQAILVP